jgi:hypothetical protein
MSDSRSKPGRLFRSGPDGQTEVDERTDTGEESTSLPEMTFSTHILSLNAMALMHLGELPGVPESERDFEAARHIIDTMLMLQSKTQENLSEEEDKLLGGLIYDLRMKFLRGAQ